MARTSSHPRAALLLLVGTLGLLWGCPPIIPPPPSKSEVGWKEGDFRYQIQEISPKVGNLPEHRESFELALAVSGDKATVKERGLVHSAPFSRSGDLQLPISETPVLYEPIALSIVPPPGTPATQGIRWTLVRPSDEEALSAPGLVGQERFHYEIISVTQDVVEVKVTGELRLAWSKGLEQLLTKSTHAPPQAIRPLLGKWSPYVDATARFNKARGRTESVKGYRVPFGFFRNTPVREEPARVQFTVREVIP